MFFFSIVGVWLILKLIGDAARSKGRKDLLWIFTGLCVMTTGFMMGWILEEILALSLFFKWSRMLDLSFLGLVMAFLFGLGLIRFIKGYLSNKGVGEFEEKMNEIGSEPKG